MVLFTAQNGDRLKILGSWELLYNVGTSVGCGLNVSREDLCGHYFHRSTSFFFFSFLAENFLVKGFSQAQSQPQPIPNFRLVMKGFDDYCRSLVSG